MFLLELPLWVDSARTLLGIGLCSHIFHMPFTCFEGISRAFTKLPSRVTLVT